ncbi:hypothetical protein Strvi_9522 (plasmid) [Streptomyces violaceusniger Tu 4113]|uniref:Uncharacterized protein n=2 Tax=Streptomyces violaceusniger TaxID=68280 RepID=G2PHC3_STRV4|nr:hypothetical protein Strvi_9522 [Streptomyces violaceusniger Tu 4113]
MPEPLRRAIHLLVSEAVQHCQEVLRYTEPDQAHDWERMTLYRATDAADTMGMAAMLIAAYCQYTGMSKDRLESYLQLSQQHSRAAGPTDADRAHVAGLLGKEAPAGAEHQGLVRMRHGRGERQAEKAQWPEDDPQKLFTEACLHGLRAKLCDDVDALDSYLPPHVAELARKVAGVLEEPQPAPA